MPYSIKRTYLSILLIEDSSDDIEVIQYVINEVLVKDRLPKVFLHIFRDGESVIKALQSPAGKLEIDLILLDWNLPGMTGGEILSQIKKIENLQLMPVVILTSSSRKEDIISAYQECCSSYLVKPAGIDETIILFRDLLKFYGRTILLPPRFYQ